MGWRFEADDLPAVDALARLVESAGLGIERRRIDIDHPARCGHAVFVPARVAQRRMFNIHGCPPGNRCERRIADMFVADGLCVQEGLVGEIEQIVDQ